MPTPVTNPPQGLRHSESPTVTGLTGAKVLALVPDSSKPSGYANTNLPADLFGQPLSRALDLPDAQQLLTNLPPAEQVTPNLLYLTPAQQWNGGSTVPANEQHTVCLHGLTATAYAPLAWLVVTTYESQGGGGPAGTTVSTQVVRPVRVDVAAGTYVPAERDIYAIGDNTTVTAALKANGHSWTKGDLLAFGTSQQQQDAAPPAVSGQPGNVLVGTADVKPGDEFDAIDQAGNAYTYKYGRRNDGTSGWKRQYKGA